MIAREQPVTPVLALLAALAFISLGLPDGLLGVAWPSMRAFFRLGIDAVGALLVATTAGYVGSSFSSGRLLRHLNVGGVLAASCALTAAALLGYAASTRWPVVVAFGVLLGLGAGAVDSALNTYAATRHGPRALNWLHACYGVGAAAGPLVMTAALTRGQPWQRGYAIVGLAQLALAACFAATLRSWRLTSGPGAGAERHPGAPMRATLRLPGATLGILVFVAYAGVEASLGVWTYTLLTEGRGVPHAEAGRAASLFWGSLTGGRLLAAAAGAPIPPARMIHMACWGVAAGAALIWLDAGAYATYAGIVLAGIACGPIFPMLVATTPARVGPADAPNAVGFEIGAAALGMAVLPGSVGVAAATLGVESIATVVFALAVLLIAAYRILDARAPLRHEAGFTARGRT